MISFKPPASFLKRQPAFVLMLVAMLILTACGDPTATPAPAPATTTAAPTATAKTQTTSTAVATTTAPATASATTAVATTTVPATTVAAATQIKPTTAATTTPANSSSSPAAELFGLIPDTRENLQWLTFNDYAALRSVYNIPAGLSFDQLQKMSEPFSRWISSTFYMVDSSIAPIEKAQSGVAEALGYDLLQVDQSVQAG